MHASDGGPTMAGNAWRKRLRDNKLLIRLRVIGVRVVV